MNNHVVRLHDRLAPDAAFAARSAAVAAGTTCDAVIPSYDLHADAAEIRVVSGAGCRNVFTDCDGSRAQMPVLPFVGCGEHTQFCVALASGAGSRVISVLRGPRSQLINSALHHDSHATLLPPSNQE